MRWSLFCFSWELESLLLLLSFNIFCRCHLFVQEDPWIPYSPPVFFQYCKLLQIQIYSFSSFSHDELCIDQGFSFHWVIQKVVYKLLRISWVTRTSSVLHSFWEILNKLLPLQDPNNLILSLPVFFWVSSLFFSWFELGKEKNLKE